MIRQTAHLKNRIREILPDVEIRSIKVHQEGLVNDVVIVNDAWVIRFTKTEFARELMDTEYQLLKFLEHLHYLILEQYNIEYIYVGSLERQKYPQLYEQKFVSNLPVIYYDDSVTIYLVPAVEAP